LDIQQHQPQPVLTAAAAEAAAAARRCRPTGHAAACHVHHLATRNYLLPSPGHVSYAWLFLLNYS